ncbi:pentatricopeptide repeat-containing protein At1g62670, mitochondrial-like isoform X1 [Nicotiana tomentosiformis]|uniref:Mitochondrial PPR protein n=1 Tax=Nicotiana tomentosiformis TaxID=4098 RepID=W5RWE5_NICTO|nr:pentatricopeptide repeat-containing protein At1g62670, mitochondrial-like [Nicotiana tomentosiformis]XP_009590799.1 pentatricopeptide repeat-containing protein At1g62670, mitochondrial-like isoform X1 [Nicotiana tomentosiformis]XP_009590800.1 pentatricopeptide repeat-containing protein At1g62670, mitochondrial-like isoform X1 [Nicotiana tomentosiformis]XP_009590801.1 pentatricopeptide repeat-containing protein At1g62670, mitochondrial-like isoform X1 [Nicotiana tomentosiformis]XP_009590806.1
MMRAAVHYSPNGNPSVSFFAISRLNAVITHSASAITPRDYSSSISTKGKPWVPKGFENVKCLDDALSLFRQMVETKPLPSLVSFSRLLKTVINMKHYSAVVSLFGEMQKLGIPADVFILGTVIDSCCLMHRTDLGFSVLAIHLKKGIPFNVVIFNTLLRGLFAENKLKDGVNLFKKLVRENICEPNRFMYETIMNGLCKRGHTDEITYNAIMDGYCLCGQMDRARFFFDFMVDKSIKPSIISYNILINGYCRNKKVDEAMQLFLEISQKGLKPNIFTCNIVLHGLFELGRTSSAQKFFVEMLSAGHIPDSYTHCTLLSGYFKNGLVEEAMSHFDKLERNREDTYIEIYNVLIDGLCKNGKLDKALAIFEKLSLIGLHPNVITYTTMINGFCREGLLDEAKDMLRKMEDNGCLPNNATYNVIMHGFLQSNKISEMKAFLRVMTVKSFSSDATTVELLIDIIAEDPSLLDMIPEFHLENKK